MPSRWACGEEDWCRGVRIGMLTGADSIGWREMGIQRREGKKDGFDLCKGNGMGGREGYDDGRDKKGRGGQHKGGKKKEEKRKKKVSLRCWIAIDE